MSALSDFVGELRRQADLLEHAAGMDDVTFAPDPESMHWQSSSPRRRWTRQDGNRCEWEYRDDEQPSEGDKPLGLDEIPSFLAAEPPRMRTRVEWFLNKFSRPPHSVEAMRGAALADARDQGIYPTIAPVLLEAIESHKQLMQAWEHNGDEHFFSMVGWDWSDAQQRWHAAVEALASLIPVSTSCNPSASAMDEAGQADSKTDNRKKNLPTLPENDDVTRLAKGIRKCDDPKATMKSIALDYTHGDERQASSLLRQLRRYPHLLNGSRFERTADN